MYKTCRKCGVEKPHDEFSKSKNKKDGLRGNCKPCHREYAKKYRQENRERVLETQKKWREKSREHSREYAKKYRQENRERIREYYQENTHIFKANYQKRRARKKASLPRLSERDELALRLLAEEAVLLGPNWHLDHIVPISKGGKHHPDNLQIVRSSYNLSKSDKLWQTRKYV